MSKVALTTGAYSSRSVIASAQRCVNLYAERNPEDSIFPFSYYPTPGLTLLGTASANVWRGLYMATNGQLFGVCGSTVYAISSAWAFTSLGNVTSTSGPVSMIDNGSYVILVDGNSGNGWTITFGTNTLTKISQASFYGSPLIGMVDQYYVLSYPGTNEWYISLNSSTTFDATDFASKSGFPDKMVAIGIARRYIYLFGEQTTEIWFNSGNAVFPFERLPGSFIQFGCAAPYSVAQMDGELYWLAQSPQGKAFVCRTNNFSATQISTFALDAEMQSYATLSDAIGYCYQINGHFFYVLTFPTANKTWVFDLSTSQWNEWNYIDSNGNLNRHRSNCFAFAYGKLVVGDYINGNLYAIDQDSYTDNGTSIPRIRSFHHMEDDNSDRIRYRELIAEMESGNGVSNQDVPVYLRWSDTRGKTYGNAVSQSMGKEGEYLTSIQWQRLGMGRDRVFELSWSVATKTALNGVFVQAESNNQ